MKVIFAQSGYKFWIETAKRLESEYGWEIPYLIGSDDMAPVAAGLFPGAIFHPNTLANRHQAPSSAAHINPAALDSDLLTAMAYYETVFLQMMDRHNFDGSFSYAKRLHFYHRQVMFWKGVLDLIQPDAVAFRIAPHMGPDYVLYALCRVLNIKTIMFERTAVPGFVYPVKSFEDGSDALRKRLKYKRGANLGKFRLSKNSMEHLERLSRTYEKAVPLHLQYKLKNIKNGGALEGSLKTYFKVAKGLAGGVVKKRNPVIIRKRFHAGMGTFAKKKLLSCYNSLTSPVDFDQPYIFAALQCEPERQTCPCGGVYRSQDLMIDALSKTVPRGWTIYVKEHVSQFKSYQYAELSRSNEYYQRLADMPNVRLVPLDVTSFELIDGAKASATVSGTVAWESVVRGRPSMLFGHGWYGDCPGVFRTNSLASLNDAIQAIHDGFTVSKMDVESFLSAVEDVSIKAYIDPIYEKLNLVDYELNKSNITKCIHDFLTAEDKTGDKA